MSVDPSPSLRVKSQYGLEIVPTPGRVCHVDGFYNLFGFSMMSAPPKQDP